MLVAGPSDCQWEVRDIIKKTIYLEYLVYFADADPFLLIHLYNVALFTIHQKNQEAHNLQIDSNKV